MQVKLHFLNRYFSLAEKVKAGVQDSRCNSASASFRLPRKEPFVIKKSEKKKFYVTDATAFVKIKR